MERGVSKDYTNTLNAIITAINNLNLSTTLNGTIDLDFGFEQDTAVNTVFNSVITNANFQSFALVPAETIATSIDDFKLNGVTLSIENIVDNVSIDIRANSVNNASGIYTVNYYLTYKG